MRKTVIMIMATVLAVPSCEVPTTGAVDFSVSAQDGSANGVEQTQGYVNQLASRYLTEETTDEGSVAIMNEIRRLAPYEVPQFHDAVISLQEAEGDPTQIALMRELAALADERGVSFLELDDNDMKETMEVVAGVPASTFDNLNLEQIDESSDHGVPPPSHCSVGYAHCSTTSFPYFVAGASCGSGCTTAYTYDRTSNSSCELLACDCRFRFSTSSRRSTIDGTTSSADCVILYYGTLISRYSSSIQDVLSGIAGPTYCFTTCSSLRSRLQVF